jgi:hypothetical protein
LVLGLIGVLAVCGAHVAPAEETNWRGLQSFGLRGLYGQADRDGIEYTSVLPRISLFLPAWIDEPLAQRHVQAEFVIEGLFSYAQGPSDSVEAGANPLVLSVRYDAGQRLVPFLEGGEGILYHDLNTDGLSGDFEFSSQAGGGVHWFLDHTTALTISYRIRHISNGGISQPNRGLNTDNVTFGISIFPKRRVDDSP